MIRQLEKSQPPSWKRPVQLRNWLCRVCGGVFQTGSENIAL